MYISLERLAKLIRRHHEFVMLVVNGAGPPPTYRDTLPTQRLRVLRLRA